MSGGVDTGALYGEINSIFKKYGLGKGLGFVPDRLEITLERARSGSIILVYREFFTYLPAEVMEVAVGNSVDFLSGMGVPREKVKRLDSGVEVRLEGDARIIYFPILEILIQDREIASRIDGACGSMRESLTGLTGLFDFAYAWDSEAEARWRSGVAKLSEVIAGNPEMQREIEELVRKRTGGREPR